MSDVLLHAPNEVTFTNALLIELCKLPGIHAHRQNCGSVPVRDARGKVVRYFDAGPPAGVADITGGVAPEGWRLEIELKMPGEERSPAQERWAAKCLAWGFVYLLIEYDAALDHRGNLARATALTAAAIEARR